MPSLHPRYPVLKVPAPARLSAAVAQGLIMPEGGPPEDGNIGLHISHTIGGLSGPPRGARGPGPRARGPHIYEGPGIRNAAHAPSNRSMRRDFRALAYIYICTGPTSACRMAGFR